MKPIKIYALVLFVVFTMALPAKSESWKCNPISGATQHPVKLVANLEDETGSKNGIIKYQDDVITTRVEAYGGLEKTQLIWMWYPDPGIANFFEINLENNFGVSGYSSMSVTKSEDGDRHYEIGDPYYESFYYCKLKENPLP